MTTELRAGRVCAEGLQSLRGRAAVVTGATAGIGLEVADALATLGADVTIVGRSEAKTHAARDELVARGVDASRLSTTHADLSRVRAVHALADELLARLPGIDVLVNNAGCYPSARVITEEGLEESWATNVLAYEVLTTRLQERLRAARGRVVIVASKRAGRLDPSDLTWERRRWNGVHAYEQTKQANRMLAWAWARRLEGTGVTIDVAHPGGVATNIAHRQTGLWGLITRLAFRTQRTPAEGAAGIVWLAARDTAGRSGAGFHADRRAIPCRWRDDVEACEQLWELCQRQIAGPACAPAGPAAPSSP